MFYLTGKTEEAKKKPLTSKEKPVASRLDSYPESCISLSYHYHSQENSHIMLFGIYLTCIYSLFTTS